MNTDLLRLLPGVRRNLDGDLALAQLAELTGASRFRFHRAFSNALRETPKRFVQRLRLEQAAGRLISGDSSVLEENEDAYSVDHPRGAT